LNKFREKVEVDLTQLKDK
jgi:hypothetical protein